MWDEEDNNPYGAFNHDAAAGHDNPALSSSCEKQDGKRSSTAN